jgi:PAP2 superfamily
MIPRTNKSNGLRVENKPNRAKRPAMLLLIALATIFTAALARADVVSEWNIKAGEIISQSGLGAPPANRVMAIVHTAVYEATNAITQRYPASAMQPEASPGASIAAAVAAANRATLIKLVPSQQPAIDGAYQNALAAIAGGTAKGAGIAVGEKAAASILAWRGDDGAATPESYRPLTTAGVYVPTIIPAAPQWPQRKPWLMTSAAQFRPAPPPALSSELWARDFNEIKAIGAKVSARRTVEQTDIARFWEATLPPIYHGVVRSVADMTGREVTQNARLFMAVTQATDDALIAVFDAKYHYNFWRPVTAIRNGDRDGNEATEGDRSWSSFVDAPMHPEYPCAHCILASTVGAVLQAELGDNPTPTLTTTSPTAKGVTRSWTRIEDFVGEVANGRVYEGVHFRNSTEVGIIMGKQVGGRAAAKYLQPVN